MLDENVIDTLRKLDRLTKEQSHVIRSIGKAYLPIDPNEILAEIRVKILERMAVLRSCLKDRNLNLEGMNESALLDSRDDQMKNELDFLEALLSIDERL